MSAVVDVRNLKISLTGRSEWIVDDVSFTIQSGEVLGLVGESGSGKSTISTALLGYFRRGAERTSGQVIIDGRELGEMTDREIRSLRGAVVAYVPQDPGTALNPALRVGSQIEEVVRTHFPNESAAQRTERIRGSFAEVALPIEDDFLRRFPHELSGGQQQRVTIAIAFACRPKVIVCDEPTTGLDATTQAQVLDTIRNLCRAYGVATLYVSHDLAVVSTLADRVAVMYAGRIVEMGSRSEIFDEPKHPYTRMLLRAAPRLHERQDVEGIPGSAPSISGRPSGCEFAPRCPLATAECRVPGPVTLFVGEGHSVRCLHYDEQLPGNVTTMLQRGLDVRDPAERVPLLRVDSLFAYYGGNVALHDIDVDVYPGECVALVGESGSGKTTLSKCIGGLHPNYTGLTELDGVTLANAPRNRSKETRKAIQYIFQNPYGSLNPRRSVAGTIVRQMKLFENLNNHEVDIRLRELLDLVALPSRLASAYPDELSGGERQRVAIARALAAGPRLLVCDEITSSLDVSVQAAIIETLRQLQEDIHIGLLFVTHNLALTRTIADRVVVMHRGRVVEQGAVADVLESPKMDYTRTLMEHTPSLSRLSRGTDTATEEL